MNLNFNSGFGKSIISKIVRKVIKKKLGCDVDTQISDLQLYETADDTGDFTSKEIGRSIRQRAAWFPQSDSDSTQIIRFYAKRRFYDLHELVVKRENVRQNTGISAESWHEAFSVEPAN